jgi:dTDP-4-dehydrorhamnose 3,5-epimerase
LRQEDLWFIPFGSALVTLVDLRASSSTRLAVEQFELAGPNAVHIPIGVAHGFYAPVETLMSYMVSGYYDGTDELGVRWNDPDLGIKWPVEAPILSDRDQSAPKWADVPSELRPS